MSGQLSWSAIDARLGTLHGFETKDPVRKWCDGGAREREGPLQPRLYGDLIRSRDACRADLEEARAQNAALQATIGRLAAHDRELRAQHDSHSTDELGRLDHEVLALRSKLDAALKQNAELTAALEAKCTALSEGQAYWRALGHTHNQTFASMSAEIRDLRAQLGDAPSPLRRELDELKDRTTCTVCLAAPRDTVWLPCLHFALCQACATPLNACPICNAKKAAQMTLFLS